MRHKNLARLNLYVAERHCKSSIDFIKILNKLKKRFLCYLVKRDKNLAMLNLNNQNLNNNLSKRIFNK
jgi:hypothetical protein